MQPDAQLVGEAGKAGDGRVALLGAHGGEQARALHLHQGGDLGRLDVAGALAGGLADEGAGVGHVTVDIAPGAHLHQAGTEALELLRHAARRPCQPMVSV